MTTSSEKAGEAFASALGEGPSRGTLAAQRVRVLEMAQRSFRPRARPNYRTLVLAFTSTAALAVLLVFALTREPTLEARFQGSGIGASARLVAMDQPSSLDFSDGSQVVLEPRASATLAELGPDHAGLRLDAGKVTASIQKRPGRTWTVIAGPYAVHVIGTRFSVAWNAGEQALEVEVREGRVRVTGGDLPPSGVLLNTGGKLRRNAAAPAVASPAPAPAVEVPKVENSGGENVEVARVSSADVPIGPLVTKGKYQEALALAEKQGFERLTRELPENDLLLLANAARYSGDSRRARQALLKLRERFAGRASADLAALYLAKIAEDVNHDPREAVRWLRTFLQGSPSGDLAAGARASLMSLLLRSGDRVSARAVAEDYLRYHATGPHADEARALVRE